MLVFVFSSLSYLDEMKSTFLHTARTFQCSVAALQTVRCRALTSERMNGDGDGDGGGNRRKEGARREDRGRRRKE